MSSPRIPPQGAPLLRLPRRRLILGLGALPIRPAQALRAFPWKPVRLVVQYPPGGASDTLARLLGSGLAHRLRQPVVVENRSGANGILATDHVAKSVPDGHTLLLTTAPPITTDLALYRKLPYDPRIDLQMISDIAHTHLVLCTHADVPAHDFKGLLTLMRQHPDSYSIGSWGVGSLPHLMQAHIESTYGLRLLHVSYRGESPMLLDLLSRQLSIAMGSVTTLHTHIGSGRLSALAQTGSRRCHLLPTLSTFAEQGFLDPVFNISAPLSLMVASGTPAETVQRLSDEVQALLQEPGIRQRFLQAGATPVGNSAAEAGAAYARRLPVLLALAQALGLKAD